MLFLLKRYVRIVSFGDYIIWNIILMFDTNTFMKGQGINMRKAISIILVLILALGMLAACETGGTTSGSATAAKSTAASGTITKIGLGVVTSINSSKDLGVDSTGNKVLPLGQVDTVMVAAAFDKDGKVVKVFIDTAQTKVNFNEDLTLKSDVTAELKTKVELADAYGMIKASTIQKEWYQQAKALGDWMVGKTAAEIKAMKTFQRDASHPAVPDVAELKSLVTITVADYLAALEKAYLSAVAVTGATSLGLGQNISMKSSKGYLKNADGTEVLPLAQVDTVMAAVAFDAAGKVAGAVIDNAQTKVQFDNTGKITTNKAGPFKTKVELGAAYGMLKSSTIQKEWYQQIEALGKWMAGKTVTDIKAMKTKQRDASHPAVPDVAELTSSVTITVQDYIAAVEEAKANAK